MKKFLIIRFSSIGDIILTSPVVRCMKKQLPNVEIHFLTKKSFAGLLEENPNIDKVYSIEKNINEVVQELKKEQYDAIIDLHYNIRSIMVRMKLQIPYFKFDKLNFKKWLLVRLKKDTMPKIHIVDRYMATVKSLNVKNDGKGLDFFIHPSQEINLSSSLPGGFEKGYLALVIGAKHFTKRLPNKKIIEFCKLHKGRILLIGGSEDETNANEILSQVDNNVFSAVGKYNFHQSASLIRQATAVLTNDTGLMHVAAAFGKKIVSVWGNTVPEFGMYPYFGNKKDVESKIVEVKNLSCRPCSKIGFQKCPKGDFRCMNEIEASSLILPDLLK